MTGTHSGSERDEDAKDAHGARLEKSWGGSGDPPQKEYPNRIVDVRLRRRFHYATTRSAASNRIEPDVGGSRGAQSCWGCVVL
jgi:hypothetical protein